MEQDYQGGRLPRVWGQCRPPTPAARWPGTGRALTLLDVFRMGTSFSKLILASSSSQARPVF